MATEKWVNGATAGWANAFGAEIQSILTGIAVLSSISIDNSSNLDMFADLSCFASVGNTAGGAFGFYLYPLNEDGSTYGDGRFGSAAAGPPAREYLVGIYDISIAVAINWRSVARQIIIPPGIFKFLFHNGSSNTSPPTFVCKYRTYNRSVA